MSLQGGHFQSFHDFSIYDEMRMDEDERLTEQLCDANLPLRYNDSNIEMSGERSGEE